MSNLGTESWVTLGVTDLMASRAAPLITAAQTTVLGAGQPDPVVEIIARVVEEIRSMIGYSGRYQVSQTDGSIPPNLKPSAVDAMVRRCLKRLNPAMYSEADRDDERTYQAMLRDLRAGTFPVDAPPDPMTTPPSTPLGRIGSNVGDTRNFTTGGLQNLL